MNCFGRLFRIEIYGESHGPETGILIDGCPAGMPLQTGDFLPDLQRRKPGAAGTTERREEDLPELASGIWNERTTGAPLLIRFANRDAHSGDYEAFRRMPRPGQADFAAQKKFAGHNDLRGGGHFSGRLTLGLVAAGVVAKKIIAPIVVRASLLEAGGETEIEKAVSQAMRAQDSIGGLVSCRAENVPVGLGEPFFDSLESLIAHIVLAVPGIKAIEFGAGFAAARMRGSDFNDPLVDATGKTSSQNAGGIVGGMSNGNPIEFRVAVRPTASIGRPQETLDLETGKPSRLEIQGRHDTCFARRVPVVIEAVTAVALADLCLIAQEKRRVSDRNHQRRPS